MPWARKRSVLLTLVVFGCICLFIHSSTTNSALVHLRPDHPANNANSVSKAENGQDEAIQAQKAVDTATPRVQVGQATSPHDKPWRERKNFLKRLQDMIALYPEPARVKALLAPIDSGGQERMKDLGFRTRMYRKYFEAWEKLHIAEDDMGEVFVRDNVVQYLQGYRAKGETDEMLASTVRDYETVKSFMARLGTTLFPWTSPFHGSHMELHAAMKKGGRGIVLTAGSRQVHYLLTSIYSFRELGCTLPIEIMYLGDKDMSEDLRDKLEVSRVPRVSLLRCHLSIATLIV